MLDRHRWITWVLLGFVALWGGPGLADELDKGHRVLIERGLQIQAQCFYVPADLGLGEYTFDARRYLDANFTGINWHYRPANPSFAAAHPTFPWARWTVQTGDSDLTPAEAPYRSSFVAFQYKDENSLNDAGVRADFRAWFEAARPKFPNTILYTNQLAFDATDVNLATYMAECRPDMLCMDSYRWKVGNTEGTWYLFSDLQRYRTFALAGNDHTGTRPIPCAVITQAFHGENLWRDPSESELRVNHFGAWTFGYKFTSAFTYNYGTSSLFVPGYDTRNPGPNYQQISEINRRGRSLGPALVRLLSKDVRFIAGQSKDAGGAVVTHPNPIGIPNWEFGDNDPYLRGWVVRNLGTRNDGLRGDVVLAWFKVLDESFDGPEYSDEIYFMVLNGLVDPAGSAIDCRQEIRLNFQFAGTPLTSVLRLNQETGQAEILELPIIPGSNGRRHLTLTYDGGTAELFKFHTGAPFVGVSTAPDTTPPSPVTGLTVQTSIEQAVVSWTNPDASDFAGTLVRRKQGGYPQTIEDGQRVADVPGQPGARAQFTDAPVPGTLAWYYAAFAYDRSRNYSAPATAWGLVQHRADFDADGDVDQSDYAFLQQCQSGNNGGLAPGCSSADQDRDGDVDGTDAERFSGCLAGSLKPPGC